MSVLVARKAPNFISQAVMPNGKIVNDYDYYQKNNEYSVIVFYPLNFTFVCPSELISLHNAIDEFKKRKVNVITVSVDSHFSHAAWRDTPIHEGGIGNVDFTMVADISHEISRIYGVEHFDENVAFRATFVIDKNKIVRAQFVNDLPLGRNIDEIIRIVDAMQHVEAFGEVCPMNWTKGSEAMTPSTQGVSNWLKTKYPTATSVWWIILANYIGINTGVNFLIFTVYLSFSFAYGEVSKFGKKIAN